MTAPRWVVGFESFLGALLADLDDGVINRIHAVVQQRYGLLGALATVAGDPLAVHVDEHGSD